MLGGIGQHGFRVMQRDDLLRYITGTNCFFTNIDLVQVIDQFSGIGEIGFKVFPTQSINLFVKIPDEFDASLFGEKLKLAGISVINGSNFPGFDDRFFRLSPRDESTNQLFLEKLAQISNELSEGQSN